MKRRTFTVRLGGGLAMPWTAVAQQRRRPFRVGILGLTTPESSAAVIASFHKAMRELGYVEGGNVAYEYRWAQGATDRLPGLAADLAALPVDVILAGNNQVIAAAQRATSTIPIVMALAIDPVRNGFVQSLNRPGGNITGVTNDVGQEMHGKMLALLKEIVPRAASVGVLVQHGVGYDRLSLDASASGLNLGIHVDDGVRDPDDVEAAFNGMVRRRIDAYYMIGGGTYFARRQRIGELALANRLPGIHYARGYVDAGALASYGPHIEERHVRAAAYIDRILKGAAPAELPVELPSRFYFVINRRTAKALGLAIPQGVLARADEVIE